jgi:hypothetical protein
MTDEKKHDDKDRQKVSDEELEDVAGGATAIEYGLIAARNSNKKKSDATEREREPDPHHHDKS